MSAAAAAFRKRRINMWIWQTCWIARQGWNARSDHLTLNLNQLEWQTTIGIRTQQELLVAITHYATSVAKDLFTAWQAVNFFVVRNQCETQADWDYALTIFRRYYSGQPANNPTA